jgi:hypothetical protein
MEVRLSFSFHGVIVFKSSDFLQDESRPCSNGRMIIGRISGL